MWFRCSALKQAQTWPGASARGSGTHNRGPSRPLRPPRRHSLQALVLGVRPPACPRRGFRARRSGRWRTSLFPWHYVSFYSGTTNFFSLSAKVLILVSEIESRQIYN